MDNLESKRIQKLLSQYDFEIVPKYKSESLTCTVCDRLMTDAYQTFCGCKYCHKCIIKHLDGVDEYCRGGKSVCREEPLVLDRNVTSSPALNRRISKSRVICPYESCGATIELCEMEAHMQLCAHKPMECPYSEIGCGCGMTSKKNMETHLQTAFVAHSQLVVESIKEQRARFDVSLEDAVNERIKCGEDQRNESIMKNKEMNEMRSQAEREKSEASSREGRAESASTAVRIDALASTGRDGEATVGELWFTVGRMAERMEGGGECFESPHVYSHDNGYRLMIIVDLMWYYSSPYLRVASVVCRGEYDALLPWPCRLSLSVAAVHRDTKQPYDTRIIEYDSNTDNRYSKRPIDTDNPPYHPSEWLSLVAHSAIRSSGTIVDDSLLLRVVVNVK